jgi:hypothetical protein
MNENNNDTYHPSKTILLEKKGETTAHREVTDDELRAICNQYVLMAPVVDLGENCVDVWVRRVYTCENCDFWKYISLRIGKCNNPIKEKMRRNEEAKRERFLGGNVFYANLLSTYKDESTPACMLHRRNGK